MIMQTKYLKNAMAFLLLLSGLVGMTGCQENTKAKEEAQYSVTTQKLVDLVESDSRIISSMEFKYPCVLKVRGSTKDIRAAHAD